MKKTEIYNRAAEITAGEFSGKKYILRGCGHCDRTRCASSHQSRALVAHLSDGQYDYISVDRFSAKLFFPADLFAFFKNQVKILSEK